MFKKVYRKGEPGSYGGTVFTEYGDGWTVASVLPKAFIYLKLAYNATDEEPVIKPVEAVEIEVDSPVRRRGRPPKVTVE